MLVEKKTVSKDGAINMNASTVHENGTELFNQTTIMLRSDDPRAPLLEQVTVSQDACVATVTVTWSPPSDDGTSDQFVSYEVLCMPDGSVTNENNNLVQVRVSGIGSTETSQVVDIVPGYSYTCQVGAMYEAEEESDSSFVVVYSRASMDFVYKYVLFRMDSN